MTAEKRGRLFELFSAHAADSLTPGEHADLQEILRRDTEARGLWFVHQDIEMGLRARLPAEPMADLGPIKGSGPPPWRLFATVAAALVAVLGLAALWWGQRGVAVEIVRTSDGASAEWVKGARVRMDDLKLVRGGMRLRLSSDVLLDVTAPVEMKLVDAMHVRLVSGRVTADVGEHGKGFVIETPQARVVDLGTRFGVDASDAAHTDVVVFQGKVEVFEPQRAGRPSPQIASLEEGEAVQVAAHGAKKRVSCVFTRGESGDWSHKAPEGALITDVRDSPEGGGSNHFYRVGVEALTAGTSLRQTHPLSWRSVAGSALPDWLEGGDWVETGGDDDSSAGLRVTLSRPAMLYVLRDARQALPSWMRNQFIDTGTRLLLERSSPKAPGEARLTLSFSIWSMKVSQPGIVTLGPTLDPGQPNKGRRYRVAAKALP